MAKLSPSEIKAKAIEMANLFANGIHFHDVALCIPKAMEMVEAVEDMTGEEKKATVVELFSEFLDRVDLPGPDIYVKPIFMAVIPIVIDCVASASNGSYEINKEKPTENTPL